MDAQVDNKVESMIKNFKEDEDIHRTRVILMTQVLDQIYVKHGMKSIDINRAVAHFKLDEDPTIEGIKKANEEIKQRLNEASAEIEAKLVKAANESFALDNLFQRFEEAVKNYAVPQLTEEGLIPEESYW